MDTNLQSFIQSLKFIFFDKIKTNNPAIDAIVTTIILATFAKCLEYFDKFQTGDFLKYFKDLYFFSKPNKIIVSGQNSTLPTNYGEIYVASAYSDRFIAILDYIIKNINNKSINEIKELYSNSINCNTTKKGEYLIVSQKKEFVIDKDIFFKIDSSIENHEADKKTSKIEMIKIELYSYRYSIKQLADYLDNITLNYRKEMNEDRKTKQFLYTAIKSSVKEDENKFNKWNEQVFHSNRNFSNLFLENKSEIIERIDFFLNNKDWYDERGIPYNLGIGLHGPAGTGKTSFIKALANKTMRDIIIIPLNIVHSRFELSQLFYESTYNGKNELNSKKFDKKIIVFEDIDCIGNIVKNREVLKEREKEIEIAISRTNANSHNHMFNGNLINGCDNKLMEISKYNNQNDELTLDDFLNLWDGVLETPGRIMIITSNFYNELDPALIRPGRIDLTYELKNVSHDIIQEIHEKYYGKRIGVEELSKIKEYFYSPAEVLNLYMTYTNDERKYIKRLQENKKLL